MTFFMPYTLSAQDSYISARGQDPRAYIGRGLFEEKLRAEKTSVSDVFSSMYRENSMYWDRYVLANSADLNQAAPTGQLPPGHTPWNQHRINVDSTS